MSPVEKETWDFLLFDDLVSLQCHKKCLPLVVLCISFQTSLFLPGLFFFVSLIKKKNIFFIFYAPSWFYPILVWSMWRKTTPCSNWCYILDLYIGTIMFSVAPLIFSVIPHVDSSLFSPTTDLMFSRSVFQAPHEEGVVLFGNAWVCVFAYFQCCYRSVSEGTAWHLYSWPCYLSHFEHCPNILWLAFYQNQNHKREVLHSWTFNFQWCIAGRGTCCWFLQLSSLLQSPLTRDLMLWVPPYIQMHIKGLCIILK